MRTHCRIIVDWTVDAHYALGFGTVLRINSELLTNSRLKVEVFGSAHVEPSFALGVPSEKNIKQNQINLCECMSTTVVLSIEIHFDKIAECELSANFFAESEREKKNPELMPIIL